MPNESSQNPLAVITGASSGIGYELAKVFAQHNYDLIVVGSSDGITEAAQAFNEYGTQVTPFRIDLASRAGAEQLYRRIEEMGRPVDVLAVNAGIGLGGEFVNTDLDKEVDMINLNVLSAVVLTKLVIKDMVNRGEGRILFTSSEAAETPGPYLSVYAATKAFLQSFSEALHFELKDKGIVVTALQPGATETDFFRRAEMLDTPVGEGKKDDPAKVAQQGYDALMAGKDHIVAGSIMNKVNVAGSKLMTEQQGAKMQSKQTKPNNVQ